MDRTLIVGHSGYRPREYRGQGIISRDNSWLVDCFEQTEEYLVLQDGEASTITGEQLEELQD